jgi:plastocyanin
LGAVLAVTASLAVPAGASAVETTHTLEVPTGTIGPYEVKQGAMEVPKPPGGGFITKMETDIVDASTGQPVPISRLMLHHIVFLNVLRKDNTCGSLTLFDNRTILGGVGLQRFYAAGEERAKLSLPAGYGYQFSGGDRWAMTYMLMNHRNVPDNAIIQYKVTVESDPLTPVEPWWLDVRDCHADPIYTVPGTEDAGSTHLRSRDYAMPAGGRIVAGAGHVHGGARDLTITKPGCGDAQIAASNPTWGLASHPFYNVQPVLHEPGPINMSAFHSAAGIPVAPGETIRLNSRYDNSLPHMRVMGIFIVYIAPDASVTQPCGPMPGDVQTLSTNQPGRNGPIDFEVPLTGLNANGEAVTIKKPPGKTKRLKHGRRFSVGDFAFSRRNVRIKRGTTLGWQFNGTELHNVTLANGPVGIASDNLDNGRSYSWRFRKTGTYRFFCTLHPVQMHQRVVVKRKKKGKKGGGKGGGSKGKGKKGD